MAPVETGVRRRFDKTYDGVVVRSLVLCLALPALGADMQFSKTLYPVMEQAACRSCHNPDGVASATRLQFPEAGASPERLEGFGKSLVSLVDRARPQQSLLLLKPTNRITHTGGERIKRDSRDEAALRAWVGYLAKMNGEELAKARGYREEVRPSGATGPVLRRLTNSQYNNTVRDLLGELSQPANQFPPEDFVNGFKNQYQAQSLSPMLFEAYSAAAEKLARNVFKRGDAADLIGCKPSDACRSQFVRSFGLKAFRRPLDAKEQKRYEALFDNHVDFALGARDVIEAVLQSPHFLFRLDETNDAALKPYAAASRLSYTLWNTMPDAALLRSASDGGLNTPNGIARAARRLLEDEKAKEALDDFVSQWLRFDRVIATARDRRIYPKFNRETANAMTEEARRFVADLVWSDRDFTELYTSEHGYINAELANLYGLPSQAKEYERVQFKPDSERAGILGQALFLTLTSKPGDTSPTSRGLFVREQFLCQHIANPPPGVSANLAPINESKPQTNRERLAMHASDQSCAACHSLLDPIGLGLEKFDAIGARREKAKLVFYPLDRKSKEPPRTVELDLDTSGWVAGIPDSKFSSPKELGAVLARSPQCQECVVKQYFRYVAGRTETSADRPMIRKVYEQFRDSKFRFKDMMISLLVAREFPNASQPYDVSRRQ